MDNDAGYTPAELANKERNETQKAVIKELKKLWACHFLGIENVDDVDENELAFLLWDIGFFVFYCKVWELSQEGLNPYYTNEKLHREARPSEAYLHLVEYLESLVVRERSQT